MEIIGLLVFASLFVFSGVRHIRNHESVASFAATAFGDCPLALQLGYVCGWPTGVFLVAAGAGAAFGIAGAFYALAAFLVAATALFHRDTLADPGTQKGIALAGAALALAQYV